MAVAGALCFAVLTEACKLFIEGRSANTANVLSSAAGTLASLAAGALFGRGVSARLRRLLPALLVGAYVVYFEWTPFAFTWSVSPVVEKMPRGAEWLPLYHYAMGARAEDVRLFLRTLTVVGALTYATTIAWRWLGEGDAARRVLRAALLAGGLGLVLEFGQFFLERVPSVTDVFCFAAAGALGAWVYLRYPPPVPSCHAKFIQPD
jgi:VanZ family protein